nr:transglutaminase family protein [Lysobacter sp.]
CQDHAHVLISAARSLGYPARYVSGYLCPLDAGTPAASHAWAEMFVESLGWVGFDAANRLSPDERYVRVASGRDYRDAAPVRGVRLGGIAETLDVTVDITETAQRTGSSQSQSQSQSAK